jgi:hypothetical protein
MLPHHKIFYLKPLSTYKTTNVIVSYLQKKEMYYLHKKNKSMRISKYFTVSKSNLKTQQNDRPDT